LHRADRAHAAIALVRTPLVELDVAGRLLGAGEEAAEHHRGGAGGDRLRDVARVANATVGDHGNVVVRGAGQCVLDRRYLGYTDACDDARRADRTRADADLDAIGAVL